MRRVSLDKLIAGASLALRGIKVDYCDVTHELSQNGIGEKLFQLIKISCPSMDQNTGIENCKFVIPVVRLRDYPENMIELLVGITLGEHSPRTWAHFEINSRDGTFTGIQDSKLEPEQLEFIKSLIPKSS